MCCEEWRQGRTVYLCVCVWGQFAQAACASQTDQSHAPVAFWLKRTAPQNRDATHQLLGHRVPKLSVWHTDEREAGEGGLEISVKARKLGFQMVMVETSIQSEFPAAVPCLSPPWLFSGSRVAAFQSLLSAHVCDLVLLKGLYFNGKTHRKPKAKLKVTINNRVLLSYVVGVVVRTWTFHGLTPQHWVGWYSSVNVFLEQKIQFEMRVGNSINS